MLLMSVFLGGFLFGALAILVAEALGLLYLLKLLNQKTKKEEAKESKVGSRDLDHQQSLNSASNKQGVVWVLESDKVPKNLPVDKVPGEQKKKKDFLEVSPVRKYAKIKDQFLILTESDGSDIAIRLKGCIIEAVSATNLSSRKWAKRFPLKVESKTSVIYNGSKTFYLYLETSWEKESWCKALRLASCDDKKILGWFTRLNEEFHSYLTSINTGYPSFMKPLAGFYTGPIDRSSKLDGSTSKVRLLWRKLAKKTSRSGVENKASWISSSGREEKKISEKSHRVQDSALGTGLVKASATVKAPNSSLEESSLPSSSSFSHSGSQSHLSVVSDADIDDKFNFDEGTLCWNLLISRLFFDAKSNAEMKRSLQARIQRTLSHMRTPSYIGEIICTDVDPGNLPFYIHGMRVLPTDVNETWALEVDIEYSGGAVLDIETRLEVRELDLQKGIGNTDSESISVRDVSSDLVRDVPSDLLEGIEYYGKQLHLSQGTVDAQEQKDKGSPKTDVLKISKDTFLASTNVSRWKSIVNSIAKHVSQVPISMGIRVAFLRGTLRLHIKPPPSDQLWFGFTSMPDIDFNLDSSVGEHKINNGHIALFLINRFKTAIRDTLVLPNCESVSIPWMLAEKDDWVPRKVAPFMWRNQDAVSDPATVREVVSTLHGEVKETSRGILSDHSECEHQKLEKVKCVQQPIGESSDSLARPSSPSHQSKMRSKSAQDLSTPLLGGDEAQENCGKHIEDIPVHQTASRSLRLEKKHSSVEEDDTRPKRMGRRARMQSIVERMGGKLEEKRRNIEEKGRNIVEKMRAP